MATSIVTPRPGDVVFVYTSGKDSFFNVLLQKWVLDDERASTEWFSHVALMLADGIALETSTQPSANEGVWSESRLTGGVRLIALEDLLLGSQRWRVLRSSSAANLASGAFEIEREYISGVYGTEYSVKAFDDHVRSTRPLLAWLADASGQSEGWTSDPDDVAARVGEEFRERVLRDFPDHKFRFHAQTFYCSDLVRVVLSMMRLIPAQDRSVTVTPSRLFDLLQGLGWADVTDDDYSVAAVAGMATTSKEAVRERYGIAMARANFFRNHHGFTELWDVVDKSHRKAIDNLDAIQDRLLKLSGTKKP